MAVSGSTVVYACPDENEIGVTSPRPFDVANVQAFYSQSFGTPPTPQIIWAVPLNQATLRVVMKVPAAATHAYERGLCPNAYWTAQPVTFLNTDVMYADVPMPSGISICSLFRHPPPNSNPSIGVHVGESFQGNRTVTGIWTILYAALANGQSTQSNVLYNESGSSLNNSYITDNPPVGPPAIFPQCLQAGLAAYQSRVCNRDVISWVVPRFYWQSVSGGPSYYLFVP